MPDYDAAKDAHDSYFAAIEAKRQRGDAHWGPRWRLIWPAPPSAGLELAGPTPRMRRGVLAQIRTADSVAVYRGGQCLAVAMFARHGWRRVEMALAIAPAAAPHMRRLVRMAQLTVSRMAETSLVIVAVRPGNQAGEKMARLVGFRRARLSSTGLWVKRKDRDG